MVIRPIPGNIFTGRRTRLVAFCTFLVGGHAVDLFSRSSLFLFLRVVSSFFLFFVNSYGFGCQPVLADVAAAREADKPRPSGGSLNPRLLRRFLGGLGFGGPAA